MSTTTNDFDAKATMSRVAFDPVALAATTAPAFPVAVLQCLISIFSVRMLKEALVQAVEQGVAL